MRKALRNGIMDKDMRVIINKDKKQDMVNLNGLMVPNMKVNYWMVYLMEKVNMFGEMEKG